MDALVSVATATEWGFTLTLPQLKRASARIRGFLSQDISSGTSTVTARGPVFRLPQRPVNSVTSVVDGDGVALDYEAQGSVITTEHTGIVTVAYTHGYATLPDELIELVCQVASRIANDSANTALASGVQQQTQSAPGGFTQSIGYGWDAWKAQAGLTAGEKDTLKRYFPRLPQIITMGPAA